MSPINEQVITLTDKVDALHQLIDQLNARVAEVIDGNCLKAESGDSKVMGAITQGNISVSDLSNLSDLATAQQVHKDVLVDSTYVTPGRSGSEQSLSPEVQIQRLTAQLTAAYNRIAALEEQLLASRISR